MTEDAAAPRARRAPSPEAVRALRTAASALDVEEILDLCFAFSKDPVRLLVYLDVLRAKGGQKSQAAACLLCFDLARRGDSRFEAEFLALVPVMEAFAGGGEAQRRALLGLLGESDYLRELWRDLEARLRSHDRRAEVDLDAEAEAIELELFDETDLLEIELDGLDEISSDDEAQRLLWLSALDQLYSFEAGLHAMFRMGSTTLSMNGGLFADTREDMNRLEAARESARSLGDRVPEANEMLPVLDLFLAAHTRARNLFGRKNRQREAHLEAGLARFAALERPPDVAVTWLLPPTSSPPAWEKVAEVLLDYVAFLGERAEGGEGGGSPQALAKAYLASSRPQPPPPVLAQGASRRRR